MVERSIPPSTKLDTAGIANVRVTDHYFQISTRGSAQKCEVVAGITTFMAMICTVFAVSGMLGRAGFGTSAVFVVVCPVTALSSLLMGSWTKLPIVISCVISSAAFMVFGLMLGQKLSPEIAPGAVLLMDVVFTATPVTSVHLWILRSLPSDIAYGTGIGIGLFLLLIASNGVGLVVKNAGTSLPVTLGHVIVFPVMMSALGLVTIFDMERRRVPGGILIVIVAISVLGLIFDPVTKFTGVFAVPSPAVAGHVSLIGAMDIRGVLMATVLPSVLALVMTAVFDVTGTVRAVADQAGLLDDKGHIISGGRAFTTDSVSSIFSVFFGGAPTATYTESMVSVAAGGKTDLTTVVVGLIFLAMMLFSPLAGLMPSYAAAPALVYVGLLMPSNVSKLYMGDAVDALSGLVCVVLIVLTHSIVTDIALGFSTLVVGRLVTDERRKLNVDTVAIAAALVVSYIGGWAI